MVARRTKQAPRQNRPADASFDSQVPATFERGGQGGCSPSSGVGTLTGCGTRHPMISLGARSQKSFSIWPRALKS